MPLLIDILWWLKVTVPRAIVAYNIGKLLGVIYYHTIGG